MSTPTTILEAKKALAAKQVSAEELARVYLERITKDTTNAFIKVTEQEALAQAKASDKRRAAGDELGELDGIPLAIKDLFCTKGIQTTAASAILKGYVPPYESTVTANLWQEGAVCLGKTNLDEFAMGSANITSHFGVVKNPLGDIGGDIGGNRGGNTSGNTGGNTSGDTGGNDSGGSALGKARGDTSGGKGKTLVPGGSSGGSAAAVAGRLALAATGSDTGGSIRQPAAFCGIVGAKPTYGVCSRYGMVAFASSLDQAGPLTNTVADAKLMLKAMASFDPKDSTSLKQAPQWEDSKPVEKLTIGIPTEYRLKELPRDITDLWQRAADKLAKRNIEIVEVSLPHTRYALPAYYIVAPAEASSNLARYDGVRYGHRSDAKELTEMYTTTRKQGFGDEVTRRILIGTYVLSAGYYDAYYLKASKVRRCILEDFTKAFSKVDALLTPTTPTAAFALDEKQDFMTMYMNDVLTVPASMAGLPAISVSCGQNSEGLPLGLQIIAPHLQEGRMFALAELLEADNKAE